MTTETKFKSIEEILDEIEAQAKEGSCKSCQFCIRNEVPQRWELNEGIIYTTHRCAIQGNFNPIDFTDGDLERAAYPYGPCENHGQWTSGDESTGKFEPIPYCMAYKAKVEDISESKEPPYRHVLVSKHWEFMELLSEAARLHSAMKAVAKGRLDELVHKLNTGDYGKGK